MAETDGVANLVTYHFLNDNLQNTGLKSLLNTAQEHANSRYELNGSKLLFIGENGPHTEFELDKTLADMLVDSSISLPRLKQAIDSADASLNSFTHGSKKGIINTNFDDFYHGRLPPRENSVAVNGQDISALNLSDSERNVLESYFSDRKLDFWLQENERISRSNRDSIALPFYNAEQKHWYCGVEDRTGKITDATPITARQAFLVTEKYLSNGRLARWAGENKENLAGYADGVAEESGLAAKLLSPIQTLKSGIEYLNRARIDRAESLRQKALEFAAEGNYKSAAGCLVSATSIFGTPKDAKLHADLGAYELLAGHYEESVYESQRALKMGVDEDTKKKVDENIRTARKHLAKPEDSSKQSVIIKHASQYLAEKLRKDAITYRGRDSYKTSLRMLEFAHRLDASNQSVVAELGTIYIMLGHIRDSLPFSEQAFNSGASSAAAKSQAEHNLSLGYTLLQMPEEAAKYQRIHEKPGIEGVVAVLSKK